MGWGYICEFGLLFITPTVTLLPLPPFRFSASCRQGAELNWEEVQRTEPHQYLRSSTAVTGTAFSSNDFLGEHAPGGPDQNFLSPFHSNLPQIRNSHTGPRRPEFIDACDLSPLASGQFGSASSLCSLWLGFGAEVLVQSQMCLCPQWEQPFLDSPARAPFVSSRHLPRKEYSLYRRLGTPRLAW